MSREEKCENYGQSLVLVLATEPGTDSGTSIVLDCTGGFGTGSGTGYGTKFSSGRVLVPAICIYTCFNNTSIVVYILIIIVLQVLK